MKDSKCDKCNREFVSEEALNMHNKAKHPELYKAPVLSNKQKKKIRNYTITLFVVLAIVGLFYWKSVPPKNAAILEISPNNFNFGTVSQANGIVSTIFKIRNDGVEDLIINNMDTSCACTSASIISKGIEGPKFTMAMHGTNPKDYELRLPSGSSADLKVYYDPNVHRNLRGPVTRFVYIFSNDPMSSRKEVRITANQVD